MNIGDFTVGSNQGINKPTKETRRRLEETGETTTYLSVKEAVLGRQHSVGSTVCLIRQCCYC